MEIGEAHIQSGCKVDLIQSLNLSLKPLEPTIEIIDTKCVRFCYFLSYVYLYEFILLHIVIQVLHSFAFFFFCIILTCHLNKLNLKQKNDRHKMNGQNDVNSWIKTDSTFLAMLSQIPSFSFYVYDNKRSRIRTFYKYVEVMG